MREVDQPGSGPGPVAAHEWEPLPGSCAPGTVADGLLPAVPPGLRSPAMQRKRWRVERPAKAAGRDRSGDRVAAFGAGAGGGRTVVCRSSCVPAVKSLAGVERAALAGAPEGTQPAVVPGRPARRGCRSRCSSPPADTMSTGCRRPRPRTCAGSCAGTPNRRDRRGDAGTDPAGRPGGLQQLELPSADASALDRRVRACGRLTQAAAERKTKIKDLVRQLMPMTPLTGDLGTADLAMLERYADPRALLAAGVAELTMLITTVSHHQQGHDRACQWRAAAAAAAELYSDHPAVPYAGTGRRGRHGHPAAARHPGRTGRHATAREAHYRQADPGQLARSLPGSPRSAPRSWSPQWAGPAASGTEPGSRPMPGSPPGQRDRRDRPQRPADEQGRTLTAALRVRAGSRYRPQARPPARQDLLPADDRTRRHPPQSLLRRRQPPRRTGMDRHHRGTPYVICDNNGNPVTPAEAKKIIAEKWTVPEDVRKRRRSRKTAGKAPQAATTGPDRRSDLPRPQRHHTAAGPSSPPPDHSASHTRPAGPADGQVGMPFNRSRATPNKRPPAA